MQTPGFLTPYNWNSKMSSPESIVVIGGGHAGIQLCAALAAGGYAGGIQLVCAEDQLPYHRPPLSKAFLKGPDEKLQFHRDEAFFTKAGVKLHLGDPATAIDRDARTVRLHSGTILSYSSLVIATGARPRQLLHVSDALANVAVVRNAQDAIRLRGLLHQHQQLTVIGGGFIGLEIAATARSLRKDVQIVESANRLLARSVSPEVAAHVLAVHQQRGVDVRLDVAVGEFKVSDGRLESLAVDGVRQGVELLVQGIGAAAEHELASATGLLCENGIVVDEFMRTSDEAILAVGDCTSFPDHRTGRRLRLESVQNATDQARTAAATLMGKILPYRSLPWFWSDQGDLRLQIAGLAPADGTRYRRNGASDGSFSIVHFLGDQLVCVESVNSAADHLAARKLLEMDRTWSPDVICDPATPLKQLV